MYDNLSANQRTCFFLCTILSGTQVLKQVVDVEEKQMMLPDLCIFDLTTAVVLHLQQL